MIDPKIKTLLGFEYNKPDKEVLAEWQTAATRVCKPCWELKYCPYGPWVENSPVLPITRKEAEEDKEACIDDLDLDDYPDEIPEEIKEMECTVFGHICPVIFCQVCGKHLLDNEVEFDHIIPLSKGGNSEEHNIRLTCFDCNRDKSDKVEI